MHLRYSNILYIINAFGWFYEWNIELKGAEWIIAEQ